MAEPSIRSLYNPLIPLNNLLQSIQHLLSPPHLLNINLRLLLSQLLLAYLLRQFIQILKLPLHQFLILLILQPLVGGKRAIAVKIRISYLIDDVFADYIDG